MPNIDSTPLNFSGISPEKPQGKYNDFDAQLKIVYAYLIKRMATATMISSDLDIYRPNICRFKKMLVNRGVLIVVFVANCKITGRKAQYLTFCPEIIERVKG